MLTGSKVLVAAVTVVALTATVLTVRSATIDAAAHARAAAEAPARDASPREYTLAYLRAARAHDCALLDYLEASGPSDWCPKAPTAWSDGTAELLAYRDVGKAASESAAHAPRAEECVPSVITQRWMNGRDAGTIDWSWCWARTPDGWRLVDEGQG
ncbi:MAG: hypothetical protein V4737_05255 [Curtobacterium sp.]